MASTLVRVTVTDDDGSGTVGTIANNAWLQSVYDSIENTFAQSTTFSPTWGNTGTANALGNGTLSATYFQIGKMVLFRIGLTFGTTTTVGNGTMTFTLPVTADSGHLGSYGLMNIRALDNDGSNYYITANDVSTTVFSLFTTASPQTAVTSTVPFTWATNDQITITAIYFAA